MDLLKIKERRERKKVREFLASISPSERQRLLVLFAKMMERTIEKGRDSISTAQIGNAPTATYSFPFHGHKLP